MWHLPWFDGDYWSARPLRQFLLAATVTILCSVAALSYAISRFVESSLEKTAAEEGALLMDFFIGPFIQELATARTLSSYSSEKLDEHVKAKLSERTKGLKIWLRDGTLVYATNKDLIGEKSPSPRITEAFSGKATATFDDLGGADYPFERHLQRPLIEIVAPLYRAGTTEIIAAGALYNNGKRLAAELGWVRIGLISIVAAITAPMLFILFLIVRRASLAIEDHRNALNKKVTEARALAVQNDTLRQEADAGRIETIQSNERLLDQIGQDLHDGPIQFLSVLKIKLGELFETMGSRKAPQKSQSKLGILELLTGTLVELRNISAGLVLPQLDGLGTEDTLWLAVRQYETLTGATVICKMDRLPACPAPVRVCLYRLVQESLNNSYYYAKGCEQHVVVSADAHWIIVNISDRGGGTAERGRGHGGLGLTGLRRRVEAVHGTFEVSSRTDGTLVTARIPVPGHIRLTK
jgi:signal transduction histidine kinase